MGNTLSVDEKAEKVLKQKLKVKWDEKSFEKVQSDEYGFTNAYLLNSANREELSSTAKTSTLVKLAKLDVEKGTTIPELVFSCCWWHPKKKSINKLIELGKQMSEQSEKEFIESVFKFRNQQGESCLTVLFEMAAAYRNRTQEYPSDQMMHNIEESFLFLTELAKSVGLDKYLDHTTDCGETPFFSASMYSEKLADVLLKNVKVNTINHNFLTPSFRVSFKIDYYFIIISVLV